MNILDQQKQGAIILAKNEVNLIRQCLNFTTSEPWIKSEEEREGAVGIPAHEVDRLLHELPNPSDESKLIISFSKAEKDAIERAIKFTLEKVDEGDIRVILNMGSSELRNFLGEFQLKTAGGQSN